MILLLELTKSRRQDKLSSCLATMPNHVTTLSRGSILQVGIAVAAAVSKDGEAAVAAVKGAPTASEGADLPPAPKLSTEELRTLANRWTIKGFSSAAGPSK